MSKGVKPPYSFCQGDIVKDRDDNVYVVEKVAKNAYMLFDANKGLFYEEFDMSHYKQLNQNIIGCIFRFLKEC